MRIDKLILKKNTNECDRKKPNKIIIFILIGAIVILGLSSFFEDSDRKESVMKESVSNQNYEREEEKRLESVLKRINGAGDVSVFISFEDGGEKILARDDRYKSSEENEGKKTSEGESLVVTTKEGSSSKPYVTEERNPEVKGVLVVAKGASSEKVKNEIYDAVKAIYGVSAHRIKVTY